MSVPPVPAPPVSVPLAPVPPASAPPASAALRAEAIACRRGGLEVLSGLSLELHAGEVVGVLGSNGAGKSTLLAALAGELPLSEGKILLDDRPLDQWRTAALARRRAVLPQSPSLGFDLPVRAVVDMGAYPHVHAHIQAAPATVQSEPGADIDEIFERALALAEIDTLIDRPYGQLSGGEQQRVQFARVLMQLLAARPPGEHRVLLLDEPTASLDPRFQIRLLQSVARLAHDEGIAAAVILHDVNLAAQWCDRLLLLAQGRAVAMGTPADVLTPAHLQEAFRIRAEVMPRPGRSERLLVLFELLDESEDEQKALNRRSSPPPA